MDELSKEIAKGGAATDEVIKELDATALADLLVFLKDSRGNVRSEAATLTSQLTGSNSGVHALAKNSDLITILVRLLGDSAEKTGKSAAGALVNLGISPRVVQQLLHSAVFWSSVLANVVSKKCHARDEQLKLLQNVTRNEDGALRLMRGRLGAQVAGHDMVLLAALLVDNPTDKQYNRVALIIANMTQVEEARALLVDAERGLLRALSQQLVSTHSVERRRGVSLAIRNCCLDPELHQQLLNQPTVIAWLLRVLLTGQGVDDEEDREGMHPVLLDALSEDNKVPLELETDKAVRQSVVECLLLLAGTPEGRTKLKAQQTYPIVKRYHKEEEDEGLEDKVFELVDFLIGDEDTLTSTTDFDSQLKTLKTSIATPADDVNKEKTADKKDEVTQTQNYQTNQDVDSDDDDEGPNYTPTQSYHVNQDIDSESDDDEEPAQNDGSNQDEDSDSDDEPALFSFDMNVEDDDDGTDKKNNSAAAQDSILRLRAAQVATAKAAAAKITAARIDAAKAVTAAAKKAAALVAAAEDAELAAAEAADVSVRVEKKEEQETPADDHEPEGLLFEVD